MVACSLHYLTVTYSEEINNFQSSYAAVAAAVSVEEQTVIIQNTRESTLSLFVRSNDITLLSVSMLAISLFCVMNDNRN